MKHIFFSPHQDDEVLTMGIPIVRCLNAGCNVYVVLCSDGVSSGVHGVLQNGQTCEKHEGAHTYALSDAEFIAARDAEFRQSCRALGCKEKNVIIPQNRCVDGFLTIAAVKELMQQTIDELLDNGEEAVVHTLSCNEANQHRDHRAVGAAAIELYESDERIKHLELYVEPYENTGRFVTETISADAQTRQRLAEAIESYKLWDPQKGRYAVGYHSVTNEFDDFLAAPKAYREVNYKKDIEPSAVIVIGRNNTTCLGACRAFGSNGVKPYGLIIDVPEGLPSFSRYWEKIVYLENNEAILDALKAFYNRPNKTVIVTTTDASTQLLDEHYDELSAHFIIANFNGRAGGITNYMDKKKQEEIAVSAGGDILPSCVIDVTSDEIAPIGFPIMLKPLDSLQGDKYHMGVCKNEEEYRNHLAKLREWGFTEFLAQRFLESPKEYIVHGAVSANGFKSYSIIENVRSFPAWAGVGSYSKFVEDAAVYDHFGKVLDGVIAAGYSGPIDIDIFVCGDTYYIDEFNWRASGKNCTGLYDGTPSLYKWYLNETGQAPESGDARDARGYVMCENPDALHVIYEGFPLKRWIADYRKASAFGLKYDDDPLPAKKEYYRLMGVYAHDCPNHKLVRKGMRFVQRCRRKAAGK